jgi:hypothetical protein
MAFIFTEEVKLGGQLVRKSIGQFHAPAVLSPPHTFDWKLGGLQIQSGNNDENKSPCPREQMEQ